MKHQYQWQIKDVTLQGAWDFANGGGGGRHSL